MCISKILEINWVLNIFKDFVLQTTRNLLNFRLLRSMTYGLRSDGVAMSANYNSGLVFIFSFLNLFFYSGPLKYMASLLISFSEYATHFYLLVLQNHKLSM